jgi:CelD/BcsL family acetyltransferase involved in cellulose biosynthesis
VDRRLADQTRAAMIRALADWPDLWNELFLDGMNPSFKDNLDGLTGHVSILQSNHPYVDLGAIGDMDCLDALGRNTRHQIRRTGRMCGDPKLERAADVAEGNAFFDGLVDQHRAIWVERGKAGAFWNDFLMGFHHRLIAEGVPDGQVQLLRSRGGDGKIMGHLYNFAYRGRVYCYQSGFERYADNRIKPGLLTHHLAIAMNRASGQRYYDFMAGDMRYKRSLSNRHGEMIWILVQRPGLAMSIERQFRYVKRRLKAWLAKRNGSSEA